MTTAPQFHTPGNRNILTTSLNLTTNTEYLFFDGIADSNTIGMEVSLNGTSWVSDPTLVQLSATDSGISFTFPNPLNYPSGYQFDTGVTNIYFRSVLISGSSSPSSLLSVTRSSDIDLINISYAAPTGVELIRLANGVRLTWSNESVRQAIGFNIYASLDKGGGDSGYVRLNSSMISVDSPTYSKSDIIDTTNKTYEFSEADAYDKDLSVVVSTLKKVANESSNLTPNTISREYERKVQNVFPLINAPSYKLSVDFSRVVTNNYYEFNHYRNAGTDSGILNSDTWSTISFETPIYYVITALYRDAVDNTIIESRYSLELVGSPLILDTTVRGIRIRDASMVAQQYIQTIQTVTPELSLIPGSTVREVHIEPFSNEIQKSYFLMDFIHRAKSFPALLAIDDPDATGTSIKVSDSQYKTNLKTAIAAANDDAVQQLIDSAFDSLALNFGIARRNRQVSQVEQTFYTLVKPTKDLYVVANATVRSGTNSAAPRFISKGLYVIPAAIADRFYNPSKRRYEIKVQMYADTPGLAGNVSAGVLDTVVNGANGFSTINESAGYGGSDNQSNLSLSEDSMRALVSVDSGTMAGYERLVSRVPGVENYYVVKSGDPFMMRDWDPIRQKHIGGKVDIYVKGSVDRTITETFAFSFSTANRIRFTVLDATNLIFRANDSRLTIDNPIEQMLYNPALNLGLYNFSNIPSDYYDLTGVQYVDYRTIKLSTLIPQPMTTIDDFIEGDYRFVSNNKFVTSVQPISSVSSVVGESSGALDPTSGYTLYRTQDPLLEGFSTMSSDYVEIHQVGGTPSGTPIQVNDEQHVMIGSIPEVLNSVGINETTLKVLSSDRLTEYNGPDSETPDFLIIQGTQSSPISLIRTQYSNIPNGATVSVDYSHDENFEVTYVVNDVLQRVQKEIDSKRHVTADVLVKQAIENPLDIISTVQLKPNQSQSKVDNLIRTAYSNQINNKSVGDPVHVSDVVSVIDNTFGVDYVVQPFSRMTLADGALRVRDGIPSESTFLPSLSSGSNAVYILTQSLPFSTIDFGGTDDIHHGVYKDNLIMAQSKSMDSIGKNPNQAFMIGRLGAVIQGYTDHGTLATQYATDSEINAARLRLTANKILVSLDMSFGPDSPENHTFSATYVVNGDTQTVDVDTSQVEFLAPGNLTMTFRSA